MKIEPGPWKSWKSPWKIVAILDGDNDNDDYYDDVYVDFEDDDGDDEDGVNYDTKNN